MTIVESKTGECGSCGREEVITEITLYDDGETQLKEWLCGTCIEDEFWNEE